MTDEPADPPSSVQPRATDYLSAAVESRARAASAIVSGAPVAPAANPFKTPLVPRNAPVRAMESDVDAGPRLRPTKAPVTPVPKADLLPSLGISAEQEDILSRIAPPAAAPALARASAEPGARSAPAAAPGAPAGPGPAARRTRSVEMPEPGEPPRARREFKAAEWDRYYNPGFFGGAKVPRMPIERQGSDPGAPAWTMVGAPKGAGVVTTSRAPYRASLKEGARVKDSRPAKEVAKFIEHREGAEVDLDGPREVPDEPEGEVARRAQFETALADLERSFQEGEAAGKPVLRADAAAAPAPPREPRGAAAVARAAERAMPFPRTSTTSPPQKPVSRASGDPRSDEDDAEIGAEDEEEGTLGRAPPPDHRADAQAHRALQHDASGAALCPTCGRRITPSNQVLVCTSCGRVACGTCGKFSVGEPTGNIYQYEYKFAFPLCQPCFERHFNIQKNLARGKAYLASGNLTYAFYHAQTAFQLQPDSPYHADAEALLKQVEARRAQMQRADKEWDEARRKLMKERTTVLK